MDGLSKGLVLGRRALGNEELDQRVRRLAGGLAQIGVTRGDCIAILMRNDLPF